MEMYGERRTLDLLCDIFVGWRWDFDGRCGGDVLEGSLNRGSGERSWASLQLSSSYSTT